MNFDAGCSFEVLLTVRLQWFDYQTMKLSDYGWSGEIHLNRQLADSGSNVFQTTILEKLSKFLIFDIAR